MKIRLEKYVHDVTLDPTEVWCESRFERGEVTDTIAHATCLKCLANLRDDGERAAQRIFELARTM